MCFLWPEKHKDGGVGAGLCGGGVWWLRMATDYLPAAHVASSPWPRCWRTILPVLSGPLLSAVCWLSFSLPISPLSVEVFRFYFISLAAPPPPIFSPISHSLGYPVLECFGGLPTQVSPRFSPLCAAPALPLFPCLLCLLSDLQVIQWASQEN